MKVNFTVEEKIENCQQFLKYWETIPDSNVAKGLETWCRRETEHHDCNTVACAGGWLCAMPYFKEMGVFEKFNGSPSAKTNYSDPPYFQDFHLSEILFGAIDLFVARVAVSNNPHLSDKAEVTNRFEKRLQQLKLELNNG